MQNDRLAIFPMDHREPGGQGRIHRFSCRFPHDFIQFAQCHHSHRFLPLVSNVLGLGGDEQTVDLSLQSVCTLPITFRPDVHPDEGTD